MATKKQEMDRLIRKDYGHPVLQELLAEIVYETRHLNKQDLDKRYNAIIQALLGRPNKENKSVGYKDDEALLARAAVMTKVCTKRNLKPKEKRRFLRISEACEEVARLKCVRGYKFQTDLPGNLDDFDRAQIRAMKLRLQGKLKGKVDYYATRHFAHGLRQEMAHQMAIDEIEYLKGFIPSWWRRYAVKS